MDCVRAQLRMLVGVLCIEGGMCVIQLPLNRLPVFNGFRAVQFCNQLYFCLSLGDVCMHVCARVCITVCNAAAMCASVQMGGMSLLHSVLVLYDAHAAVWCCVCVCVCTAGQDIQRPVPHVHVPHNLQVIYSHIAPCKHSRVHTLPDECRW